MPIFFNIYFSKSTSSVWKRFQALYDAFGLTHEKLSGEWNAGPDDKDSSINSKENFFIANGWDLDMTTNILSSENNLCKFKPLCEAKNVATKAGI